MAESTVGTVSIDQLSVGRYQVTFAVDVEQLRSGAAGHADVVSTEEHRADRHAHDLVGRGEPRFLLTAKEAAEELAISRTTVHDLLRSGRLESVKIGRLRRIP
ncbi:helix-turn-helix domain-containing protein [Spirillospora sp. NBC_00431]